MKNFFAGILQSVKCLFGHHARIIGGINIIAYEPTKALRYDSFLKCSHCEREVSNVPKT